MGRWPRKYLGIKICVRHSEDSALASVDAAAHDSKVAGTRGTGTMQSPLQGFVQPPGRSSPAPHLLFQMHSQCSSSGTLLIQLRDCFASCNLPEVMLKKIIPPYLCTTMEVSKVLEKGQENPVADLADCSLKWASWFSCFSYTGLIRNNLQLSCL